MISNKPILSLLLATNTVAWSCKMVYLFFSRQSKDLMIIWMRSREHSGLPGIPILLLSSTRIIWRCRGILVWGWPSSASYVYDIFFIYKIYRWHNFRKWEPEDARTMNTSVNLTCRKFSMWINRSSSGSRVYDMCVGGATGAVVTCKVDRRECEHWSDMRVWYTENRATSTSWEFSVIDSWPRLSTTIMPGGTITVRRLRSRSNVGRCGSSA